MVDLAGGLPQPVYIVGSVLDGEYDRTGEKVPVNMGHKYTYDTSGNLVTDTVTDGTSTWVRTYTWSNGYQTEDSGWVKQ